MVKQEITPEHNWPVLFRKYGPRKGGCVIAIFPYDAEDIRNPDIVGCYVHVGQHGNGSLHGMMAATKPATPAEYADLKAELESEPYNYRFRVYQRVPPDARKVREAQLAELNKRRREQV